MQQSYKANAEEVEMPFYLLLKTATKTNTLPRI